MFIEAVCYAAHQGRPRTISTGAPVAADGVTRPRRSKIRLGALVLVKKGHLGREQNTKTPLVHYFLNLVQRPTHLQNAQMVFLKAPWRFQQKPSPIKLAMVISHSNSRVSAVANELQ
jgi:hypothetical protein